jgi:hypothetical protein
MGTWEHRRLQGYWGDTALLLRISKSPQKGGAQPQERLKSAEGPGRLTKDAEQ